MELGLLYYNARFYIPGLGRFASADTIVPNPANPQSYNRYSYVENRPLNFSDPTGHCKRPGDCVVVGGVGYSDPGTVAQQVESAARQLAKEGDIVAPYVAEYAQEVWQLQETLEQATDYMSRLDQNMKEFDNVYYYAQETTFETFNGDLPALLTDTLVENRVPPTMVRSGARLLVRGVAEVGESGLKWMILATNYATNTAEHLGTEAIRAGLTAALVNAETEYGTAVRALKGAIRLNELRESSPE